MDTVPPTQARPNEPPARWLGTITVEVEAAYDGNADHLAEDMSTLVERALQERGADVYGSSCGAREPGEARQDTARAVPDENSTDVTKMEDHGLTPAQFTEARLDKLQEDNARLRDDLSALRASLVAEVRTRRLVIEEEDGFERIVAEGQGSHGTVEVHARPVDPERAAEGAVEGEDATVVLVGSDESIAAAAGVYVMAGGHSFGGLMVHGRSVAPNAAEGPYASLDLDSPLKLPGIVIDSEGLKNAPMRVYMEKERATE